MSRIKFTVEDSKVSEVLKVLLDSGIDIKDWEVNGDESKNIIHIHHPYYKEEKDDNWYSWCKKPIGVDPFYVKIGDEGFDYTGSTGMSDKVYQYHSTTDNKTHIYKPTITTSGVTTSDDYHQSSSDSIKMNSSTLARVATLESNTTILMKSELDFPKHSL